MKKSFEIIGTVDLEYDENSPEFKEAILSYKECIDKHASANDMLKQVAYSLATNGFEHMIEGVGYVKYKKELMLDCVFSGITLLNEINFDVE
jgi:hypothetical protein